MITLQNGEALSDNYLKVRIAGQHELNQMIKVDVTEVDDVGVVAVAQAVELVDV